jgi:S-adenosylmethionine hydrolase
MKKIISFATDFGLSDGSVGVVKGVINRIDPELKVNDISHGIPPQDIKYGSLLLMRAIQYIPQGVFTWGCRSRSRNREKTNSYRNRMGCNDRPR